MNGRLLDAEKRTKSMLGPELRSQAQAPHIWEICKSTGDGAILVFGKFLDPKSVRDALLFAACAMAEMHDHRKRLPQDALNGLDARMAVAYGAVFMTQDLDGHDDILGDAINLCARLAGSKRASAGSILVEESIYHNIMVSSGLYLTNGDKSHPRSGTLSDFVLGRQPDGNNFLYLHYDGEHKTKDRVLRAYRLSGRIDGIDLHRRPTRDSATGRRTETDGQR
jgi:hypothetical protein